VRPVRFGLAGLVAVVIATACGQESPTEAGGPLIPGDAVRTFEIDLDPSIWLEADTAFSGFDDVIGANYFVAAENFENVMSAHILARFTVGRTISAPDSSGTSRSDTVPALIGGRIVIQLDTARSDLPRPFAVSLRRVEEDWDAATATWELSVDSAGLRKSWNQPGAGGGVLVSTATWPQSLDSLGVPFDSLSIDVDSATIAMWTDTTNFRSAMIAVSTQDARLRASDLVLRVDARPSFRPDTVVTVTVRPTDSRFIFTPRPSPSSSQLLVGGRPAWRSYVRFKDGIDTISIACPLVAADCRTRLRDAHITYAAVLLTPTASPSGFLPQDSVRLTTAELLFSGQAPLERSPIGNAISVGRDFLTPLRFVAPAGGEPTEVPVTTFVRALATDTTTTGTRPTRWFGILPQVEGSDFGVAAFEPGPRLRLVLTVARELQLR
jgi:hypothetical protein